MTSKSPQIQISSGLTLLLAIACGVIAANIYYAQPLIKPISESLKLPIATAGLIVTLTQLGYGLGLLFIVPLGDLVENRRLVLCLLGLSFFALLGAAFFQDAGMFLFLCLLIGLSSVSVQILVPFAAHLAPEATRGEVVGNVMSGLLLGIMLARPLASLITGQSSWHVVFYTSAGMMILIAILLAYKLPKRVLTSNLRYGELMRSMVQLALSIPILQRRSLYQACLFGAFSLFWTTIPLLLASPEFNMDQTGIAWFALAGVAGAIAAPIAGRIADRGWTRSATAVAMLAVALAFLITLFTQEMKIGRLALLVFAAILLDFGAAANLTLGQRAIFQLDPRYRSRINGVYMSIFFLGGALSSVIGSWAFARGGWTLAGWIGFAFPVLALIYFLTE